MDRRITPPKHVTSPTWGPPQPGKQALRTRDLQPFTNVYSLKPTKHNVTKIAIELRLSLTQAQCTTTTMSQKEIQYIESERKIYSKKSDGKVRLLD